jgi:predicted phage terminase large subunit-like protein
MTYYPQLGQEELDKIRKDRKIRRALAKKSHYWFFSLYLPHYINCEFAPFHHEIFKLTEENVEFAVLVAFRGSAKSTLVTLSYVIWSIVGIQQKKFVLIVSQTQAQAKLHLENIKRELENNDLLKSDIGPFESPEDEWGSNSIVIPKFGARIAAVSTEQSIRGVRHGQYRPDLIICDDIEDINSVKTKEGRDRTNTWFNAEIVPVGDKGTKTLVIGNLLHEDSLIMRFKKSIYDGRLSGEFFEYPLIDDGKNILWPAKYPTMEDVEKLKKTFLQESAFYREYLLKIISDEDRIVKREWIKYYDNLPSPDADDFEFAGVGIDLAISERESADYTAMVSAYMFGRGEKLGVYILPNPINKRMDFPTTVDTAISLSKTVVHGEQTKLFIEEVGYQKAFIDYLSSKSIPVEGVQVHGQDKRTRLALVTHIIQQGKVWFPRHGAEELINQLTGFGIERHDDLADAFSLLLLKILEESSKPGFQFCIVDCSRPYIDNLFREFHGDSDDWD